MSKDIMIVPRTNKHDQDCWTDAMALALGQSYDEIDKLFDPFKSEGGGLYTGYIDGHLCKNGFTHWTYNDRPSAPTVEQAVRMYNTYDHHVVMRIDLDQEEDYDPEEELAEGETYGFHIFYVHKMEIHDTLKSKETVEFLLDCKITDIFMKEV